MKTEILTRTDRDIARAAAFLAAGALVAFGTETVYGVGADARNAEAVAKIFAAKGRPHFNPLICHYASADEAFAHVHANPAAERLADYFWPGPLTMVLPRRADCPVALLAGAGLESLAVRVPAHPVAAKLLAAVGGAIAAPSANRSGGVSPTSIVHVLAGLEGRIAAVIDSGMCRVGLESTVIDLTGPEPCLLRPGGVNLEALEAAIGSVRHPIGHERATANRTLRSPGLLVSHYAPNLPVRLNAIDVAPNEALLAFGRELPGAGLGFQLSASENLNEAAARLFEGLHWLDDHARGLLRIAVMPVPGYGLGLAINDRLARAAAPRGVSDQSETP
ncbi:MAG: L-threonylcarbamoyladenylate synthase [Acidocella sp.]|nr:L-threonylcarbamoyladenylate synthase [Acidocella sp.]